MGGIGCVIIFHEGATLVYGQPNIQTGRPPVTITGRASSANSPERTLSITESFREDGCVARSAAMAGKQMTGPVEVTDVSAKRYFVKDAAAEEFDEVPMTAATYDRHAKPPTTCAAAVRGTGECDPLGAERILGYPVQRAVIKLANRADGSVEVFLA